MLKSTNGVFFDPISREHVAAIGLPSSSRILLVPLGRLLLGQPSKNARRKAKRYGRALPANTDAEIHRRCLEAVNRYWNR